MPVGRRSVSNGATTITCWKFPDDGCGFTLSDTLPDSTGLSGMRERGKRLGGPVIIFSHPGQGTIVQAIFPVKPRS